MVMAVVVRGNLAPFRTGVSDSVRGRVYASPLAKMLPLLDNGNILESRCIG